MIYNDEQKGVDKTQVPGADAEESSVSPELVNTQADWQQIEVEFMEKFMKENLKQVPVGDISAPNRAKLSDALNLLIRLKAEVVAKKVGLLEKEDFIKSMVAKLKASDKVNIDEDEFNKTEKSVMNFAQLLDEMIAEIDADVLFYTKLLSDTPPTHVMAYKEESDDFKDHLEARITSIKKYAKNAKRDLAVSYSRYCFGFDVQMRQIAYVEHVLKHAAKSADAKETEEA